jgi:hypothetical protein
MMMKTVLRIILSISIFISCVSSFSQNVLLVRKFGSKKNALYSAGSYIKFSYFDNNGYVRKTSGNINVINEETIIINYDEEVELAKIKTVFVPRNMLVRFEEVGIIAGLGYMGLTGINNLISGTGYSSKTGFIIAGSVAAASAAAIPFNNKKFHLDEPDKYTWEVLVP